jgi:hypothetical protein
VCGVGGGAGVKEGCVWCRGWGVGGGGDVCE